MSDILLIGSCEPFSGKSAMVLGIAKRLWQEKKKVRIGKPLATCIELTNLPSMSYEGLIDDDVKFIIYIKYRRGEFNFFSRIIV